MLELIETRKRKPLQDFLASLPGATKASIMEVCIDMHEPYRDAIRSALPHAAIVCDRFHVERMVADAVDALRRVTQGSVPKGDKAPLFRARRKLRRAPRDSPSKTSTTSPPCSMIIPISSSHGRLHGT